MLNDFQEVHENEYDVSDQDSIISSASSEESLDEIFHDAEDMEEMEIHNDLDGWAQKILCNGSDISLGESIYKILDFFSKLSN